MPLAQYGQTNPAGLDPWPIESTLAPLAAAGSSANAQLMLSDYQYQREAANNLYGQDMAAQHQFAKQQLAQQLQEQYMKSAMDAVQHRGGLSVLRGVAPGALANVDPSVVSDIEGGLTGLQRATTFEKGAAGLSSATTAGFQPSSGQASVATGGLAGPQGTPLQLQIEREKEAAANARAASSASGERGPGITFSGKPDEQGNQINITGGGKTSLKTPEQVRDYAIAHGLAPPVVQPPGVTPPPTAPAAKSGRVPSLPMAKTDTPANAPATGGIQVLSNSTPNVAETANKIRASLNTGGGGLTPGQVAAIKRGMAMNGGQVKIGVAPGGTWHVLDDKNNVVQ